LSETKPKEKTETGTSTKIAKGISVGKQKFRKIFKGTLCIGEIQSLTQISQ
jgi:hypothetical protein